MELKITKTYTIKVDGNNKMKCGKDKCQYYLRDMFGDRCCTLNRKTSECDYDDIVEDNNRTEYCKKFFENKEIKK